MPDPTGEGEIQLDGSLWRASLQGQCPQGDNDTPYAICNWQNIQVAIHAELAKQLNQYSLDRPLKSLRWHLQHRMDNDPAHWMTGRKSKHNAFLGKIK